MMKIKEDAAESSISSTMHEHDNEDPYFNHNHQSLRSNAATIATNSSHHSVFNLNHPDGLQMTMMTTRATTTPFVLFDDDEEQQQQQNWQHDLIANADVASNASSNSSNDGIEVYRHYAAEGGDDSKSLSSNNQNNNSNRSSTGASGGIASASQTTKKLRASIKRASFLVKNVWYKRVMLICSTICSAILGLQTTTFVKESSPEAVVQFLDNLVFGFLILFTVQVAIELIHYNTKIRKLLSNRGQVLSSKQRRAIVVAGHHAAGWVLFDVFIVVLSWVGSHTFLVLRMFRVLNGLRRAPGVSELRLLIHAIGNALPKMTALAALIGVVLYVFAVMFCDFYGEKVSYFETPGATIWTLFRILTLDGWSDIAYETYKIYPHSWILLVVYILVAVFFCISLLIGVMSQAVAQAAHERMWTCLEDNKSAASTKTATTNMMSAPPLLMKHRRGGGGGGSVITDDLMSDADDSWARLERKVDALTKSLQQLAQAQAATQELLRKEN